MAAESAMGAEYLFGKLNVTALTNALGTASRIYRGEVPQNPITGQTALFPCCVFHMQSGSDVWGVGAVRIMVRPLWTIKIGVDDQPYKIAEAIYSIADGLLHNTSGTVTAGSIYSCYRETELPGYSEIKSGGGYTRWVGGVYRLEGRATVTP